MLRRPSTLPEIAMLVNADFTRRVALAPSSSRSGWVASPRRGVERLMLDRLGAEHGRATSMVRYAPRTSFPRHEHPGGEEILVLSGTFSDEQGDYPAGWYLRNPPGSSHSPFSEDGTEIFVKLWQMPLSETRAVRIDTRDPSAWREDAGRVICPLFSAGTERVYLRRLAESEALFSASVESAELLVLSGELVAGPLLYPKGSWMRLPAGQYPEIAARTNGALVYIKTGHLAHVMAGK